MPGRAERSGHGAIAEATLSRLYLIVGGAIVVALFAALIVPWFIHWNDYRTNFAAEASRILGHRVYVEGDAHATILPSPSLTFTDVKVDDEAGNNLMTVGRFDVVIELMPLLQGEIRVVSMTLEKPVVNVAIDGDGKLAWLSRIKLREPFDPNKVVLDDIKIRDGTLKYADAQTGEQLTFTGVSAQMSARTLTGPWHVDGSYLDNGSRAQFRISTGRVLDDGAIRVKADLIPARLPMTVSVDGPLGIGPAGGFTWNGTYSAAQVTAADDSENADAAANGPTGWRSEGAFTLTNDRLDISKAVLSNGPVDRPLSVAGTLTLNFGKAPSFAATAEARQVDLDRTLGNGPSQPADVSAAADSLVAWLSQLPVPDIPGSVHFKVPTIVVGGRIIEDVAFNAAPAEGGWQIDSLSAKLPGQASVALSGLMTTTRKFGFDGEAHLSVRQPATFATWWRGSSEEGAGRLLAPFDLAGHLVVGPARVSFDKATVRIDNATITGHFDWGEEAKNHRRKLGAVVDASGRIDFVQLKALAELLAGHNLTNVAAVADDYSLQVTAESFAYQDLTIKGIAVNAVYGDDALVVTKVQIDDIGGARIENTNGEIDNLSGDPHGHLYTTLYAPELTGLARLADRFLPQSGFTRWLDAAAPSLGVAVIKNAEITAPPPNGGSGFAFTVNNGVAASTTFNLSAQFSGGFAHWRTKPADVKAMLDSPDSAGLARQFGLAAVTLDKDNGAHVEVQAKGIPAEGLDTVVVTDLAGVIANASGKLKIAEDLAPSFAGKIGVTSDNVDPIVAMAGLTMPGQPQGTALELDGGQLMVSRDGVGLTWKNSKIGPAIASGDVTLAPDGDGWRIGGSVVSDRANLGWIAALGLGTAPLPTGDAAEPWSRTPFAAPAYGRLSGALQVKADRLDVGDLGLTGTEFSLALQPQRIDLNLTAGRLAGGTVTGGMSIHNVDGNAAVSGRFDLKGAALDSFAWRRDGRSVGTGTLDLSAYFESTGRSPSGLVSTMTGGGAVAVHDGLVRYVNPNAVRPIVRFSDLGQQYSEDTLRTAFGESVEAGNLTFKDAGGPFAIVAGDVQLKNLMVKSAGLAVSGGADIDLNTMTIDSDWTLNFDPVDNKVQGDQPKAGLVFRGPLAAPSRSVDVVQLAWYLNRREEARLEEILALDSATRAEKQRLGWLADKLKTDADQRAEDLRIAAEREAARREAAARRAAILDAFHVNREVLVERRHVEALAAFAARLTDQQKQAEATAGAAVEAAKAARDTADAAAAQLAKARAAEADTAAKADAAATDLEQAKAVADAAAKDAAQRADASDRAAQVLADARTVEAQAKADADKAASARADAGKTLQAASAKADSAVKAASKAAAMAQSAAAEKDAADKAAAAARSARDAARTDLAAAEAAVKDAQVAADAADSQATLLGGGETSAESEKAKADTEAQAAADALKQAVAARDAAAGQLAAAKGKAETAKKIADAAESMANMAKQAASLAQSLAGDGADAQAIANAEQQQASAASAAAQAATRKAAADDAAKAASDAQAAFATADKTLAEAQQRQEGATKAATEADARVKNATANANQAASDRASARTNLDAALKMRDAAQAALDAKETTVAKTAADAEAASAAATEAATAAVRADSDATAALAVKAEAEKQATQLAGIASDAAKALQEASAKRATAAADAKAAAAKATEAANAAAAAAKTLAARTGANAAAQAAAKAAVGERATAETAAAEAETQAKTAEAGAQVATAEATTAADAARAAQQTADQAAQDAVGAGPIDIPLPTAAPKSGAAMAPGAAALAAKPVAAKPAAPRPGTAPLSILPGTSARNGELVITAPNY